MTSNLGTTDRFIRLLLGIAVIALGLTHFVNGWLALAAYIFGAIALFTGVVGYCPAWSLCGISTCPLKSRQNN
jgi:uncharacterized membrane protein HdeD (DUF308 family)